MRILRLCIHKLLLAFAWRKLQGLPRWSVLECSHSKPSALTMWLSQSCRYGAQSQVTTLCRHGNHIPYPSPSDFPTINCLSVAWEQFLLLPFDIAWLCLNFMVCRYPHYRLQGAFRAKLLMMNSFAWMLNTSRLLKQMSVILFSISWRRHAKQSTINIVLMKFHIWLEEGSSYCFERFKFIVGVGWDWVHLVRRSLVGLFGLQVMMNVEQ
jgi:hypothetical protein